jgi:L-threonylcarbamoyladenylate synthase
MMTFANEIKGIASYEQVEEAIATLQTGGLLLYPTDTLWSIGCDATDPVALERICNLRGHKSTDDFEILVDSIAMLRRYIHQIHPKLETLLIYHTRPLTILFEEGRNLPERLLRPDGSVAIRLVQDDFCRALIAAYSRPLIAVNACKHGHPYPPSFGAVSSAVLEGVECVIKYRQEDGEDGEPSVMVQLSEKEELLFLRE